MPITNASKERPVKNVTYQIAGGLLSVIATVLIGLPMANTANAAPCDETVGNSIDSYLKRHPDVKQELSAKSEAEGGGPNVLDYLSRHPDVRQHLISLSQKCTP
jgi:hypothetical protein